MSDRVCVEVEGRKGENKDTPKLSIIIPIYNVEKYIEPCLWSIAKQTYNDYEVLMIDDGSTDGSAGICRFFTMDKRFIYAYKENGGVSSARNAGLDMAKGRYLSFIDPDDVIESNMYEIMIADLENNDADFVQCKTRLLKDNGEYNRKTNQYIDFWENLNAMDMRMTNISVNNNEVLERICDNKYNCLSWGKVFKRELWGEARYPIELSLGEDMATVIPVLAKANKAMFVDNTTYYYRVREMSLLHGTVTKERFIEDVDGSQRMYGTLVKEHPEIIKEAKRLKDYYDIGCLSNYMKSARREKKASTLHALMQIADHMKDNEMVPYLGKVCTILANIQNSK